MTHRSFSCNLISEVAIKLEVCSSKSSLLQSEFAMYKKMGAVVATPGTRRPKSKGQTPPVKIMF